MSILWLWPKNNWKRGKTVLRIHQGEKKREREMRNLWICKLTMRRWLESWLLKSFAKIHFWFTSHGHIQVHWRFHIFDSSYNSFLCPLITSATMLFIYDRTFWFSEALFSWDRAVDLSHIFSKFFFSFLFFLFLRVPLMPSPSLCCHVRWT